MKVKEVSLRQLLKGQIVFRVPPFQRRYAWRQREFQRLWDDITCVLDGEKGRHFMGTVVLEPVRNATQRAIIDGQQRLGTFTVLLKVLWELSKTYDGSLGKTLHAGLYSKSAQKFVPSLNDQDSFVHLLDNPALLKKTKHRNVWACYVFYYRAALGYIENAPGAKTYAIRKLTRVILDDLFFVRILLTDRDDAQGIFETINYTGVPLTAADLARNFVLGQAKNGKQQQQLNHEYWQKIEGAIEDSIADEASNARKAQLQRVLPEFLRAMLVVEQQKYVSFSDLYRQLRLFFGSGSIEERLALTLSYAEVFRIFNNPENEKSKKLKEQLVHFKDLRMTTHYPVLLVLYRAYLQGHISLADLLSSMRFIESFVVRRAFNSKVSRDLNQRFADVAKELSAHPRSSKLAALLRVSLAKKRWPTDQEFKANFVSSPIYSTSPSIARFTLFSIEWLRGNRDEIATGRKVQIEHVFPQQPGSGWTGNLTELKKNLHVIGNLSLTGYNSKYSNKSFKDKMNGPNGLKKSPFWLNKIIAKSDEWTAEEIRKRGIVLLRGALKTWPGPKTAGK